MPLKGKGVGRFADTFESEDTHEERNMQRRINGVENFPGDSGDLRPGSLYILRGGGGGLK